jgi:hypothetical protein
MSYFVIGGLVIAVLLGFGAGFMTHKRSDRWCPACGSTLRCTSCAGHPTHFEAQRLLNNAASPR